MIPRRYQTTSECMIEAEVDRDGLISQVWILYDPDPHGDIEQREIRTVRIPLDPNRLGDAEAEHLLEQAAEDAAVSRRA